jgi:hypothetical protein
MVESWGKEHILKALQSESLLGLEEKYIEPLLGEMRSVARRFDLLAEGCRQSDSPELKGMVQPLDLAARMVDDLLEEALEISLRRAIEENAWANPEQFDE